MLLRTRLVQAGRHRVHAPSFTVRSILGSTPLIPFTTSSWTTKSREDNMRLPLGASWAGFLSTTTSPPPPSSQPPYDIANLPQPPTMGPGIRDLLDPKQYVFVDTTANLAKYCQKNTAAIFIAPRRFGKSTLLNLRQAYLELPNDEALKLFAPLAAGKDLKAAIEAGRKQVPVINLNLSLGTDVLPADMGKRSNIQLVREARRLGIELTPESYAADSLDQLIDELRIKGTPPAVQIDELDYSMMASMQKGEDEDTYKQRAAFVASLFAILKDAMSHGRIHSTFAVGITHIGWPGISSSLNNLELVSWRVEKERPTIGYTWSQIEHHFAQHINAYVKAKGQGKPEAVVKAQLKEDLTRMYDGYRFHPSDAQPLYNPWSVNNFFRQGTLKPYWAVSINAEWLLGRVNADVVKKFLNLPEGVALAVTESQLEKASSTFPHNDLDSEEQAALLVHAGELAIRHGAGDSTAPWSVGIPNEEVRRAVLPVLLRKLTGLQLSKLRSPTTARLLQEHKVQEFFDCIVASGLQMPAKNLKEGSNTYNEYPLPGLMYRVIYDLSAMFPQDLLVRRAFVEASPGGTGRQRMDVALLLKATWDSPPNQDTLLVWEFNIGDPNILPPEAKAQLQGYVQQLKDNKAIEFKELKASVVMFSPLENPEIKLKIKVWNVGLN